MPRTSQTEAHQAQPKHTPHTPIRRTPRRKLDARDDEIILDVLLADRRANNLRRPRWTHMARLLTARTNDPRAVTAKQVQSRADRLCNVYDIIRRCIDSGMEWNKKRGCFVEHVRRDNALWAQHLANHPEAAQWRWHSWRLYSRAHRLWSLDPPTDTSDEASRSEVQPKRRVLQRLGTSVEPAAQAFPRSNRPRPPLEPLDDNRVEIWRRQTEIQSLREPTPLSAGESTTQTPRGTILVPRRLTSPRAPPSLASLAERTDAGVGMEAIRVVLESSSSLRYQIEAIQIVCETSFLTAEEKVRLVVFFLHNQPFAHTLVILKDSDIKEPVLRSWL